MGKFTDFLPRFVRRYADLEPGLPGRGRQVC
jgi:hypothetical protein